jgi:hypothetical protein
MREREREREIKKKQPCPTKGIRDRKWYLGRYVIIWSFNVVV